MRGPSRSWWPGLVADGLAMILGAACGVALVFVCIGAAAMLRRLDGVLATWGMAP